MEGKKPQEGVWGNLRSRVPDGGGSGGLRISEATTISEEANGWNESPGIYTDAMAEAWKQVVDAVHQRGGLIFLQLWHMGRASHSSFHDGRPAVAPSAIKINEEYLHTPTGKQPHEVPRALDTAEIPRVVGDYRRAAERDEALTASHKAKAVSDFLRNMLASANPRKADAPDVRVRDLLDEASGELERGSLEAQPEIEATIHSTLGTSYQSIGMYVEAEEHFRAALATIAMARVILPMVCAAFLQFRITRLCAIGPPSPLKRDFSAGRAASCLPVNVLRLTRSARSVEEAIASSLGV